METKKSTPTAISFKNTWNNPKGGAVHYYNIEFANGDKGSFGSTKEPQDKFALNIEAEYTKEEKQQGNYLNVIIDKPKPANTGGGYKGRPYDPEAEKIKQHLIIRQSSLSAAVELGVANGMNATKSKEILQIAEVFYQWVITPYKEKI